MSCDISLQTRANNETRRQWLQEVLSLIPEIPQELNPTLYDERKELEKRLFAALPRCRARTKERFIKWAQLQLLRLDANVNSSAVLSWKPAPASSGDFDSIRNGDVILIDLGPAIWKLPADALPWVSSIWPVYAKKIGKGRYAVYKSVDGRDVPVHQIYLNAEKGEEIAASDGDFMNYCKVKARVTVKPVFSDGVACLPGNVSPVNEQTRLESERMVRIFTSSRLPTIRTQNATVRKTLIKVSCRRSIPAMATR